MKSSDFLVHLARLASQPHCILGGHIAARLAMSAQAALQQGGSDDHEGDCVPTPWEDREKIEITPSGLAIVSMHGALYRGFDQFTAWIWDVCRFEFLENAIATVRSRPDVRAVLFDVDSPGGSVIGTQETAAQIAQLSSEKPTFAFTAGYCASAAYYLASQCGRIISTPSAYVGSVGTKIAFYDVTEMLTKAGIKLELVTGGRLKGMCEPGKPLTDEERAFLQADVDRLTDDFRAAVRSGRGKDIAEDDMQGQVFAGSVALGKNLVDALALTRADVLAEISAQLPQTVAVA
jgi:signal peptide peptidase SppA